MNLLKIYKIIILLLTFFFSICSANTLPKVIVCLTGRIEEALPSYKETFINGVNLAISEFEMNQFIHIKTYFYNNEALAPLREYKKMRADGCSAIIGFEYLTDLLLVSKIQPDTTIPYFTSYASTLKSMKIPKNIFIFSPTYDFLAQKMLHFLNQKFGTIHNVLIATEVNRDSSVEYEQAYAEIFKKNKIHFDRFNFLESDQDIASELKKNIGHKKYDYIFLLSGAIASAKIANIMNDQKIIFIGTENYGSYEMPSFYLLLNNNKIKSFFIRNISFLNADKALLSFKNKYIQKYHSDPTAISAYSYDAMKIILIALKNKKSLKNNSLMDIKYRGVTGVYFKNDQFYRSNNYTILSVTPSGYKYEA